MEEIINEISKETLEELKKAGKLPFPLYYKEVFNKIAYDRKIIDSLNPKLLELNKSFDEELLEKTHETLTHINETSKEIKNSSKEIVEEIEETSPDEVKEMIIKYSADLIGKITKMEEKIRSLEGELDKAYKELLIDPLTKVYNRKALEKDLKEILEKGKDRDLDLIVAMIDIDDFKRINDEYGHLVGDFVLIKIAQIIKSMIRKTDKLYRYGGDEFIIVFNRSVLINAERSIERIIEKINRTALKYKDHLIKVTISVGIAEHRKGDTLETLIKKADDALYRVKSAEKNGYNIY
jgi:diguanylate cyclase